MLNITVYKLINFYKGINFLHTVESEIWLLASEKSAVPTARCAHAQRLRNCQHLAVCNFEHATFVLEIAGGFQKSGPDPKNFLNFRTLRTQCNDVISPNQNKTQKITYQYSSSTVHHTKESEIMTRQFLSYSLLISVVQDYNAEYLLPHISCAWAHMGRGATPWSL